MRKIADYKIGQTWETRDGREVIINEINPERKYPIQGQCQTHKLFHMFGTCGHTVPGVNAGVDLVTLKEEA